MKKQTFLQAKKLSKKELKTIAGGMLNCMQPSVPCEGPDCPPINIPKEPRDYCTIISPQCGQIVCRP